MEDKGLTVSEKQKSLNIDTEQGTAEEGETLTRKAITGIHQILRVLREAVENGQITSAQAKRFRADLGIQNSFFTKKQTSPAKRKAKRKAQKLARRKQRGKVKGQKRTGGWRG